MSLEIVSVDNEFPDNEVLLGWREQIRRATAAGSGLIIAGNGSKSFYGRRMQGETLATRDYAGIIAYEPTELVITARCGTSLDEIDAALSGQGQFLAFEPPRFSGVPTIGGVVAAGLAGPRRMAVGSVRDAVLGVRLLDGSGNWLNFGGQVMKNVAGYDVSRLLTGTLGCLGVLAEVSLKVLPKPRAEATLRFEMSEGDALSRLNGWSGQALPLSAGSWQDGVLHLRLSGAEPAIAAARQKLGGELVADATAANLWCSLRDHTAPFFTAAAGQALIRIALPDTTPPLSLPQSLSLPNPPPLIEWGGAQRWYHADPAALVEIRRLAARHQGHATRFRSQDETSCDEVFTPLAAPLMRIHQALKRSFDPAGVFNRGRMYKEI